MPTLGQRFKRVRSRLGESQVDFGKRFGVDQSTVAKWEKNKQIPQDHRLDTLADLETEIEPNQDDDGDSSTNRNALFTMVPVAGDIGAGATVYLVEGETNLPVSYVKAPRGFGAVEALRVQGDSMWPVYRNGDTVFFDHREAEFPLNRNIEYIVQLKDGRILLKMVEPASDGRYNLISWNAPPETGVEIVNARAVRYVRKAKAA